MRTDGSFSAASLTFGPNLPLPRPTLTATPSSEILDDSTVTVAGTSFGSATSVAISECWWEGPEQYAQGCEGKTTIGVSAGSFTTPYTVTSMPALCTVPTTCTILAEDASNPLNFQTAEITAIPDATVPTGVSIQPGPGTAIAKVPVTLVVPRTEAFAEPFSTRDGTAVSGTDYTASSGMVDFAPGQTTATISVPVTGAALTTADKYFTMTVGDLALTGVSQTTVTLVPAAWSSTFGVDSVVGALLQRGQDVYGIPIPDGIGAVTDLAAGAYTPGGEFTPSPWPYPVPTDGPTVLSLDWTAARTTELTNLSNYFQLTPEQTEVLIASLAAFFVALLPPPQPT